ncbi:hypothetical protein D3C78_1730440 [compost metagenome]
MVATKGFIKPWLSERRRYTSSRSASHIMPQRSGEPGNWKVTPLPTTGTWR